MKIIQKYRALNVAINCSILGLVLGMVGSFGGVIYYAIQHDAYRDLPREAKLAAPMPELSPLVFIGVALFAVSVWVLSTLQNRERSLRRILDELSVDEEGLELGRDELRRRAHKRLRELARALDRAERCEKGEIPTTDLEVEALIDPEEFRTKFKELHKACVQEKIIEDAGQGRFFREEA
ncbi:MAG: hypothetical protein R3B52_00725 [Candidatus Paceibacterota bacterium]